MRVPSRLQTVAFGALAGMLLFGSSLSAQEPNGAVNGLQVSIHLNRAESDQSNIPRFVVALRNTGHTDLLLNLGSMARRDAKEYPTAISLTLIDSEGNQQQLELRVLPDALGSEAAPLFLPLPVGATFSFPVDLGNYWAVGSGGRASKLAPGSYSIAAQFNGFEAAGNLPAITGLMKTMELVDSPTPFDAVISRIGGPTSNVLEFEIPRR